MQWLKCLFYCVSLSCNYRCNNTRPPGLIYLEGKGPTSSAEPSGRGEVIDIAEMAREQLRSKLPDGSTNHQTAKAHKLCKEMNYLTIEVKKYATRAQAWGWAALFTVILLVGQGMEARGQGIEIREFSPSSQIGQRLNERISQSEQKYIISGKGIGEKQGPRMVRAVQLTSADLLGELSDLQHEQYLISAEMLIIDVQEGQTLRITPESLALLSSVRYIYLRIAGSGGPSVASVQSYFTGFEPEEGEEPIVVLFAGHEVQESAV